MNPQQRFLKRHQETLDNLQKQILGATAELEQLNAQSAVLRKKRNLVLKQVQEEADKLRADLETKLATRKTTLKTEINALENNKQALVTELDALTGAVTETELTKQQLNQDIESLKLDKQRFSTTVSDLKRQIRPLKDDIERLEGVKGAIERDITALNDEIETIRQQKQAVQTELADIESKKQSLQVSFETKRDQLTKQLLDLDAQIQRKIDMLRDISKKDDAIREELSKQRTELKKREEVIARREMVVGIATEKIKNNADMLKL